MKTFIRNFLIRKLGLSYQKPEVYVVLDTTHQVDSVWFDPYKAETHTIQGNQKLEAIEAPFRLLRPISVQRGNAILDAKEGVYRSS